MTSLAPQRRRNVGAVSNDRRSRIELIYCLPCNSLSRSVGVAEDFLGTCQHRIISLTLTLGLRRMLDVIVNDNCVFSKNQAGRCAQPRRDPDDLYQAHRPRRRRLPHLA